MMEDRPGAESRVQYVPLVHKAFEALKAGLQHTWALWIFITVVGVLWFISEKTGLIYTPAEDGILGGFIALIFTEGVRAGLRAIGDHRRHEG